MSAWLGRRGPRFDCPPPQSGYGWWYIDVVSDDREFGLVLIAFVGNPFSPFYARALAAGLPADPRDFCAMNVVLYRRGRKLWTFDEYSRDALTASEDTLTIGRASLRWSAEEQLIADFDTRSPLLGTELRGRIILTPPGLHSEVVELSPGHLWVPIAPVARAEVVLAEPALRFAGRAYHDSNRGDAPLVRGFEHWQWARAARATQTDVTYHGLDAAGRAFAIARRYDAGGAVQTLHPSRTAALPRSRWGLTRSALCDGPSTLERNLENAPFYARAELSLELAGHRSHAVHETMDLRRLRQAWVSAAFYLRMTRANTGDGLELGLAARLDDPTRRDV